MKATTKTTIGGHRPERRAALESLTATLRSYFAELVESTRNTEGGFPDEVLDRVQPRLAEQRIENAAEWLIVEKFGRETNEEAIRSFFAVLQEHSNEIERTEPHRCDPGGDLFALYVYVQERAWVGLHLLIYGRPEALLVTVTGNGDDWLGVLAKAYVEERCQEEHEVFEREEQRVREARESSRPLVDVEARYQATPKIVPSMSWAFDALGVPLQDGDLGDERFRLTSDPQAMPLIPPSGRLPFLSCGGHQRKPHQACFPLGYEDGDLLPLSVSDLTIAPKVMSTHASKLALLAFGFDELHRNRRIRTTLRELTLRINPGLEKIGRYAEPIPKALDQLRSIVLHIPGKEDGRWVGVRVFAADDANRAGLDDVIYFGIDAGFRERLLGAVPEGFRRSLNGWFLLDMKAALGVPNKGGGLALRILVRASAGWNATSRQQKERREGVLIRHHRDEFVEMLNTLPVRTVEVLRSSGAIDPRAKKKATDSKSDSRAAVKKALGRWVDEGAMGFRETRSGIWEIHAPSDWLDAWSDSCKRVAEGEALRV